MEILQYVLIPIDRMHVHLPVTPHRTRKRISIIPLIEQDDLYVLVTVATAAIECVAGLKS